MPSNEPLTGGLLDQAKVMLARGLGAQQDIDTEGAIDYLRTGNRAYGGQGRISSWWGGFGGSVVRGERTATEVIAGMSGFADPSRGMWGGASGIRDEAHARQILRRGFTPSAMAGRVPGQLARFLKQARPGGLGSVLGVAFFGADVGLRVHSGENLMPATLRATGGTAASAVGGIIGGALVGSIIPGGGVPGAIVGGFIGYGLGEAGANVGIGAAGLHGDLGRRARRMELGGRVSSANMTRAAYTMRARALQQINRSGINSRSLLGRESALMHMR